MNIQTWQTIGGVVAAFAALFAGIYAVVTRPLLMSQQSIQAQLTDIIQRLTRIENKLGDHSERITRLEERTSLLKR
jgi:type II secretory pathway component PulM